MRCCGGVCDLRAKFRWGPVLSSSERLLLFEISTVFLFALSVFEGRREAAMMADNVPGVPVRVSHQDITSPDTQYEHHGKAV